MYSFGGKWGRGGLLEQASEARTRLNNARAAELEGAQKPGLRAIIGGQTVDQNDLESVRAAQAGINSRALDEQAQMRAQQSFGSRTVTRGAPGGLRGGANLGQPGGGNPAIPPNSPISGAALNPAVEAYEDMMDPLQQGGRGPDTNFQGGQYNIIQKQQQDFGAGQPRVPLRSAARQQPSTTLSDTLGEFKQDEGFRNGGMFTKQRSVKQPGYQSGGKVRMPPAYEEAPMAEPTPTPTPMPTPAPIPGYKWGNTPPNAPGAPPAQPEAPMRDSYRWDDAKGMRGYKCGGRVKKGMAKGGRIGDGDEDDGKDSVEVRVREGEYLLNPPTVANAFGGGDYEAGVQALDQIVEQSTGQEPGPTPVNEEGEAVRQGMRNGGKVMMGYNQGGFVDDFGNIVDPRQMNPQQRAYYETPQGRAAMAGNTRGTTQAVTQSQAQIAQAAKAAADAEALRTGPPLPRGLRWERAAAEYGKQVKPALKNFARKTGEYAKGMAAPVLGGAVEVGRQLSDPVKNQYYNDPNVPWEQKALQTGSDVVDSGLRYGAGVFGAELGAAAGLGWGSIPLGIAGGAGGYALGDALWEGENDALRAYRAANPQATQQEAEAAVTAAPGAYGRAFGTGNIELPQNGLRSAAQPVPANQARVVQNTGGPNGEQIIREDINGVPTFTNVRQGGFRGDATTLQAEADRRAAEDAQTRETQGQRMLSSGNLAMSGRLEEAAAMRAAELGAASKAPKAKIADLDTQAKDRFQIPQYDEDGNLTGYEDDQAKRVAFYDAMAAIREANPDFDPYAADRNGQNELFDSFEQVYSDTMKAMRAAKQQGKANSDLPRTGANGLRYVPGSNISLGDVWGPEATMGDYAAGIFSDAPINDGFVEDGLTGARIPARRAVQDPRVGLDREAILRYGIPER